VIVCQQIKNTKIKLLEIEGAPPVDISWRDVCEFLKIATGNEVEHVPAAIKNMCDTLGLENYSMWPILIPKQTRDQIVLDRKNQIKQSILRAPGYIETWVKIRKFLDSLGDPSLDEDTLRRTVPANHKSLFENLRKGITRPTYSTSSTTTGRLTITSGPNFLTMPRESRNALRATQKGSSIYSIDFTSLEPRVALWMSSASNVDEDVYTSVMEMCDIADRAVAKLATLSSLYGAGIQRLASTVGNQKRAKQLIERVSNFFEIPACLEKLEAEAQLGIITNHFGRPLYEATKQPRVRVNHFIQSTSADLTNLLFSDLCDNNQDVIPLILIHDALIAEVPDDSREEFFESCKSISYDGFRFPTKIELLNN
tara:strand:+ start:3147 stop:4250 length:1104 start_codon:yes stop_codon:yes gene_type:complete